MLPIILDVETINIALVGNGAQAVKRLALLDAAGVQGLVIYAPDAIPELKAAAKDRLIERLPEEEEIAALHILYIANIDELEEERLTHLARAHKTLVNVEDRKALCDFHVPALVRRGDMLLTASTGGKSPGLARRLKTHLELLFPEYWGAYLDELSAARDEWRREGADFSELMRRTDQMIDEKGWLLL